MRQAGAKANDEQTRGRPLWDAPLDPDEPLGPHLTLWLAPDGEEPEFVGEDGRRAAPPPRWEKTLRDRAAEWLERERRETQPAPEDWECRKCHIAREKKDD